MPKEGERRIHEFYIHILLPRHTCAHPHLPFSAADPIAPTTLPDRHNRSRGRRSLITPKGCVRTARTTIRRRRTDSRRGHNTLLHSARSRKLPFPEVHTTAAHRKWFTPHTHTHAHCTVQCTWHTRTLWLLHGRPVRPVQKLCYIKYILLLYYNAIFFRFRFGLF